MSTTATADAHVASRATATGRRVAHELEPGQYYPEYSLTSHPGTGDVVELPDGERAYYADHAGAWGLFRRAVARLEGDTVVRNSRTAPESLTGICGEAPGLTHAERRGLLVSYRDLVGWVE